MKSRIPVFLGLLIMLSACAGGPPPRPETWQRSDYRYLQTYLSWLIETQMDKQAIEGLSIAIVDDQQVVWSQGFGYADRHRDVPASAETVYRVGSISKLFTDTLVMQLAEQGKLDIDQALQRYLPNFSIKSRFADTAAITPRNIMSHHSGLPGDIVNGMWTHHPRPFGQLVEQLKSEYVSNPANTVFSYSNLGVTLLGTMLETVSATPFSVYADQQLLKPLGMRTARFAPGLEGELASKSYRFGDEKPEAPLRDMPAGGLNASVLDLSRFMTMVFAGGASDGRQLLKPQTVAAMLKPQNADVPLDAGLKVGLGWMLRDNLNIGPIAEHGGATLYQFSLLSLATDHKIGVVVLSNSPNQALQKINNAALKLAVAIKTGQAFRETETPAIETRAPNAAEQSQFGGHYATMLGYVDAANTGDGISADLNGNSLDIVVRPDGQFGIRYWLLGFIPIQPEELAEVGLSLKEIAGRRVLLAYTEGQTVPIGEKIVPTGIPAAWRRRLGDYRIVNLADGEAIIPERCALRERNGFLVLEYALPSFDVEKQTWALKPIDDEQAITYGLGRGMGDTLRVVKMDGRELIAYSGYLLQKQ